MRIHRQVLLGAVMSSLFVAPCVLAQTATQVVTFSVVSSSRVSIGNLSAPVPASVTSINGKIRTTAMASGATYAVVTNETNQKIAVSLDADVPRAVSLSVALAAPRGAMSNGQRALTTTPTDVVTGISHADSGLLPVAYQWRSSPGVPAAVLRNRVVTYTITAGL